MNSRIVAPTPLPFELGCCIHSINVAQSCLSFNCIAYHLGTLDVRHVEPEGNVEAEPEDGARVDQSRRWKDRLECMFGLG